MGQKVGCPRRPVLPESDPQAARAPARSDPPRSMATSSGPPAAKAAPAAAHRRSTQLFDYSKLENRGHVGDDSKACLLDGDLWRAIGIASQGSNSARLALTCHDCARELLGTPAEGLWLNLLRQDFKGDAEAAAALLGFRGDRPSSLALYSEMARVHKHMAMGGYSVAMGNIARPPHMNGAPPAALVVPNHPQLLDTGMGAAHAVHEAAGPELSNHIEMLLSQRPQGYDIGSVVTCPGFRTGSKVIIFVISPLAMMSQAVRLELLTRSYRNAFAAIREASAQTAALAAIATGVGGISPAQAGKVCAREAFAHLAAGGGTCATICFDRGGTEGFANERTSVLNSPLAASGNERPPENIDVDPTNVLMGLFQHMAMGGHPGAPPGQ